jgi:hypothetical protein
VTAAEQPPPQAHDASHGLSRDQTGLSAQRSPFDFRHMGAALPDARYTSYPATTIPRQAWQLAGDTRLSRNQDYGRATLHSVHGHEVASTQYLGQPYQQGRHIDGFQTNYTGGLVGYGHPRTFVRSYPQPLHPQPLHPQPLHPQPLQPILAQQPIAYAPTSTGYYPVQNHFARQIYDNPSGISFRHEHNNLTPSNAPGPPALYAPPAAALAELRLLQTGPNCEFIASMVFGGTIDLLIANSCKQTYL